MKILTTFFLLISLAATSQTMTRQTIIDTTRVDGQRFIISMPYEQVIINFADSLTQINDSTWAVVPGYISMVNSKAIFRINRIRVIAGDTISKGETVSIPLYKIGNNAVAFLTGHPTRKQVKKETKVWISRKLNQE